MKGPTPRQLTILMARFEMKLTLKEIAQRMSISRERVRQLEKEGLKRVIGLGKSSPPPSLRSEAVAEGDGGAPEDV